jgi:hypothetical protein
MPNGEANSPRFLQCALNVSGQITSLFSRCSCSHEMAHIPFRVPVFRGHAHPAKSSKFPLIATFRLASSDIDPAIRINRPLKLRPAFAISAPAQRRRQAGAGKGLQVPIVIGQTSDDVTL